MPVVRRPAPRSWTAQGRTLWLPRTRGQDREDGSGEWARRVRIVRRASRATGTRRTRRARRTRRRGGGEAIRLPGGLSSSSRRKHGISADDGGRDAPFVRPTNGRVRRPGRRVSGMCCRCWLAVVDGKVGRGEVTCDAMFRGCGRRGWVCSVHSATVCLGQASPKKGYQMSNGRWPWDWVSRQRSPRQESKRGKKSKTVGKKRLGVMLCRDWTRGLFYYDWEGGRGREGRGNERTFRRGL